MRGLQEKEVMTMTTKAERHERDEMAADQMRRDNLAAEQDRQTHLVDPLTHPSSGDPPPAISPAGDRLGAVPMTRNAVADQEQAKHEGLEAAEQNMPTKAEQASAAPAAKRAERKTQTPTHDGSPMSSAEKHAVKENEAAHKATDSKK